MAEEKTLYLIDTASPGEMAPIWSLLLDELSDRWESAEVDAYPNYQWPSFQRLPDAIQRAQATLAQFGRDQNQGSKDPLMSVHLSLKDQHHLELLRVYGPYSINVDVREVGAQDSLFGIADEGTSGWIYLSSEELERIKKALRERGIDAELVLKAAAKTKKWPRSPFRHRTGSMSNSRDADPNP